MDLTDVLYESREHIATITLNRPDRLNAFGVKMREDLEAALRAASDDREVYVAIITGAGRAFCSGLDLKERSERKTPRTAASFLRGMEIPRIALSTSKPLVAAVHGPAIGVGFELALLCDYRIGSQDARMGDVHVKRGIVQDCAAPVTLPRVAGWANASKILLTGETFGAQELLQMGVLNEVAPAEKLQEAARAFAQRITCNAPLAVQMTKRLMRMAQRAELDDALDYSYTLMGLLQQTEDWTEGMQSFLEKRPPRFKGR